MFGSNPIRKQDLSSPSQLWIQEVFPTIQGEGPFAGRPAIFVRLGGCNLKCWWCDTDFESSTWRPQLTELTQAIVLAGEQVRTDLVVLTGGEPFRQNIVPFVRDLLALQYTVQIETNGIAWIDEMDDLVEAGIGEQLTIVCSPKTGKLHKKIIQWADAFKYIVSAQDADKEDGLPILSTQVRDKRMRLARPPKHVEVYVQALDEYDVKKNTANEEHTVALVKKYGYRLSYQMHKQLGLP